jgi:hypothetical protein
MKKNKIKYMFSREIYGIGHREQPWAGEKWLRLGKNEKKNLLYPDSFNK